MYAKFLRVRELLLKSFIVLVIIYFGLIALSLAVTGYLFLTLDTYTAKIESLIYNKTGYNLIIKNIDTKLNASYLPELVFNGISLQNEKNPSQQLSIAKVDIVLSYSSIWNLTPVFNKILISGTQIDLSKEDNGDIIINGLDLSPFMNTGKKSSFDFESWLLLQENVKITNFNFNFLDKKSHIPPITLHNISAGLENNWGSRHLIYIDILNSNGGNLEAKLQWTGGKIEQWESWSIGEFYLANVNESGSLLDSINKYLPDIGLLKKFNSQAVISAKIIDGKIQYTKADFGLNNFNIALDSNSNIVNFPKLSGSLNLRLVSDKLYKLEATDLTISTQTGYLFDKAQISGDYKVDIGGQISLNNTNIQAFNNILHRIPDFAKISLNGNINTVKFMWDGNILKPKNYNFYSTFSDLSTKSTDSKWPSIDHVSGNIIFNRESGVINLTLKNSVLTYTKIFAVPYKFNQLNTKIQWLSSKDGKVIVTIPGTEIISSDFKIKAQGSYTYVPNNGAGYIDITAHLDKIKASLVGDYLPKQIGNDTHKWLKNAIKDGYVVNANLILKGDLDKFPYEKGGGLFYITANIKNAQLNYIDKWPTIDNIDGQFILKNQSIVIKANNAMISGNKLSGANAEIPDYTANKVLLNATGDAYGSTQNFLTYLKNTWLNETLGGLPTTVNATGDGKVKISLTIPFDKPETTKVSGQYSFESNGLKFNSYPVPNLENVDGNLNFTEKGVNIKNITFNTLGSNAKLLAKTDNDGEMSFNINVESLNYTSASRFYLPALGNIVNGVANTHIGMIINSTGLNKLTVTSNLLGVAIDAPVPLLKNKEDSNKFELLLTQNGKILNLDYMFKDNLRGNVSFDNNGKMIVANTVLGDGSNVTLNQPDLAKVNVQINLPSFDAANWIKFITKFTSNSESPSITNNVTTESGVTTHSKPSEADSIFPISVTIITNNMKLNSLNLGDGVANIWSTQNDTSFNFNFVHADGYGGYNYALNKVVMSLNNLRLSAANNNIPSSNITESAINTSLAYSSDILNWPLIDLSIKNLYYQNRLIGEFGIKLSTHDKNLIMKDGYIHNDDMDLSFNGDSMCVLCSEAKQYSNIQFLAKFNNLGNIINNLGKGRIIEKGSGDIIGAVGWSGGVEDFDVDNTYGAISIKLKSGKFLQVNNGVLGNLVGGMLGIVNLQTLTQVSSLGFNDLFSNGFFFNSLEATVNLLKGKLELMQFKMLGSTADVVSSGEINLEKETINLRMQVVPKLGLTTAVTAGVVTFNPLVGIGAFFAEMALGEPINKLFGFDMRITGDLSQPEINNVEVGKQVYNNINSAIGKTN